MAEGKTEEPLSSDALQSDDDKGGGVTLTPDQAPGHLLPASETGVDPQGGKSSAGSPIIPPD